VLRRDRFLNYLRAERSFLTMGPPQRWQYIRLLSVGSKKAAKVIIWS
jgi:hypothetical protein